MRGIKRVISLNSEVEFVNDIEMEQFKSIIYRDNSERLGANAEDDEKLGRKLGRNGEKEEKLGRKLVRNFDLKLSKNKKLILELIIEDSKVTIKELSTKIGISTSAIEKNIKNLKENGVLKRVGSTKSGRWEVVGK